MRLVSTPALVSLLAVVVVILGGALWLFGGHVAVKVAAPGVVVSPPGNAPVVSPVAGVVAAPLTPVGTRVRNGEVVAEVRRTDGSLERLTAPVTGTVVSLASGDFDALKAGETILTVAPATAPMAAVVFVPTQSAGEIVAGLSAEIAPDTVDVAETGVLLGSVEEITALPVPRDRVVSVLGDAELADEVMKAGPVHEVVVQLDTDASDPLGLEWTGNGPARGEELVSGTIAVAQLVLREQSPWQALLGIDGDTPSGSGDRSAADSGDGPTGAQFLPVGATLRAGDAVVSLEVARTPEQQETGLMFRTELAADRGMAFPFEKRASVGFWMKDTLIPLDIVYVRDGLVVNIVAEAPPCEADPCPTYPSDGKVDAVIELPGGRAAELGIAVGDTLDLTYG